LDVKAVQRITFRAMGCEMQAMLDLDEPGSMELLEQVPLWFEEWEAHLSRFRDDSELCELNRHAGQPMRVGLVLWDVLQRASEAVTWSQGLVVPTMLNALVAAGYNRSFEMLNQESEARDDSARSPVAVRPSQPLKDWLDIEWRPYERSLMLPPGARVDLGGVAKGWAADEAVKRLSVHGPAMVDAGGDIAVSGPMADGGKWPIGVADPFSPEKSLETLMLDGGAVATSGRDYRRWQMDGEWQHHIIDPRTSHPAETDVLSATVVAPTAWQADVAAKVAFIKGSQDGMAWLEAQPQLSGLLVLEDGTIKRNA
jgi:thiamine biosynthesis lipoprotein